MDQEQETNIRLQEQFTALSDRVGELSKSIRELRYVVLFAYIVPIALFFLQQLI